MIFPGETQAGTAAGRASALASVHRQGLSSSAPLSGFPARDEWLFLRYKGEVSDEEQVQRELSWRVRWKCHSDTTNQGKREPVWPKSDTHPLHLMKPKSSSLTHEMNIQEMNPLSETPNLSHSMSQWQENHLVLRCKRLSPYSFESSLYQHSKSKAVQLHFNP